MRLAIASLMNERIVMTEQQENSRALALSAKTVLAVCDAIVESFGPALSEVLPQEVFLGLHAVTKMDIGNVRAKANRHFGMTQ